MFNVANAEVKLGVEGGLTFADMRADETAQIIANLSGSTVNYEYDEATWIGLMARMKIVYTCTV